MILTVTFNPAVDHTYTLEEDLEKDNISRTENSQFDAGGKGINVSTYLKALGHETTATGLLGGFTGSFIESKLDEEGLNHDFVRGRTTRINTTIIADNSEYKINHSGPETGNEMVEEVLNKIEDRDPETVVISGSLPPGLGYSAVERIQEKSETDVVVDLHGNVLGELEGNYLLAKPNKDELSEATDIEVNSVEKAQEASEVLLGKGFENVLASLGEDGALLSTEDESWYVEGLEADVVDTTGAGDALLSAMLSGLAEGKDKRKSLKKALAFATIVVETPGTRTPEIEKLEKCVEKVDVEEL